MVPPGRLRTWATGAPGSALIVVSPLSAISPELVSVVPGRRPKRPKTTFDDTVPRLSMSRPNTAEPSSTDSAADSGIVNVRPATPGSMVPFEIRSFSPSPIPESGPTTNRLLPTRSTPPRSAAPVTVTVPPWKVTAPPDSTSNPATVADTSWNWTPAAAAGKHTRSVAAGDAPVVQNEPSRNDANPVLGPIHDVVHVGVWALTVAPGQGQVDNAHTMAISIAAGPRQRGARPVDRFADVVRLTSIIVKSSTAHLQERHWYVLYQWTRRRRRHRPGPTGRCCCASPARPQRSAAMTSPGVPGSRRSHSVPTRPAAADPVGRC